jgi:hypothetical protein
LLLFFKKEVFPSSYFLRTAVIALFQPRRLIVAVILILLPLLAQWPELSGFATCNPIYDAGPRIGPRDSLLGGACINDGNVGGTLQALGGASAEQWLHGRVPWWNSLAAAGLPLAAEMQPASFFLPFILLLHFFSGVLWIKAVLQILAGFFTFVCLREMGLLCAAALAGAAAFELNGTYAWFGDAPAFPGTFLPLLIFAIERSRHRALQGRPGGALPLALGMGWMLLAGFPETALMNGLLAGAWSVLVLARTPGRARRALFGKIAAGGLVGLALSAPLTVAFIDDLPRSGLGLHWSVEFSLLQGGQPLVLLLPGAFGPPIADLDLFAWQGAGGYLPATVGFLALVSMLAARRRNPWRWLAAGWCAVWIGAFLGEPVTHAIWRALPAVNQVQISRYSMPSIEFCACLLLAAAIDDWLRGRRSARAPALVAAAAAIIALLTALAVSDAAWFGRFGNGLHDMKPTNVIYLLVALASAIVAVGATTALLRAPASHSRLRVLAVVLAADIGIPFMLPTLAGLRHPRMDLSPIAWLRDHAGFSRTYTLGFQLNSNYGTYFGIDTLNAFSLPLPLAWANYVPRLDIRANDWFSMFVFHDRPGAVATLQAHRAAFEQAGVRYILLPRAGDEIAALHDPAFHRAFDGEQSRIYELPDAAPYFQIIGGPCSIAVKNRERLDADCARPGHLVRREMFFPGWHARVNGHKAPLGEAQDIFQQIDLPAGHASIQFFYAPPRAGLGWRLFVAGLTGVAVMVWQGRKDLFFEKKRQIILPDSAR